MGAADEVDEDERVEGDERDRERRIDPADARARRATIQAIGRDGERRRSPSATTGRRGTATSAERVAEQREDRAVDGDGVAVVGDPARRLVAVRDPTGAYS